MSDPVSPVVVANVPAPGYAHGIEVRGKFSFVACGRDGLAVFDLSNPAFPVLAGKLAMPDAARDLFLAGEYAFVACDHPGLVVADISDPVHPEIVATARTAGHAWGVAIEGEYAYVAAGRGVEIFDVEDARRPRHVGSAYAGDRVFHVTAANGLIAFPAGPAGVALFAPQCSRIGPHEVTAFTATAESATAAGVEQAFALEAGRPDPFSSRELYTTIRFHLPEPAQATLRIFDAAGRMVRGLVDAGLDPGEHVAHWDGRNDRGQETGAGVYFYRLEAAGRSAARRLVRIK